MGLLMLLGRLLLGLQLLRPGLRRRLSLWVLKLRLLCAYPRLSLWLPLQTHTTFYRCIICGGPLWYLCCIFAGSSK